MLKDRHYKVEIKLKNKVKRKTEKNEQNIKATMSWK